MTVAQEANVTAEAIGLIMRQLALTSEYAFGEIWSETAAGYTTYGAKNLVWTSFVRKHNTDFWYKRVRNNVARRRANRTL
jgi:hypothetical protein